MKVDQWSHDLVEDLKRAVAEGGNGKPPIDPPRSDTQDDGMSDLPFRVGRLEEDVRELRTDMRAVRDGLGEIKETLVKMEARLEARIATAESRLDNRIAGVDNRVAGLEGRLTGIEGRFAHIPTTLQLLGFALTVLVLGGLLRYFEPRFASTSQMTPPVITAPAR